MQQGGPGPRGAPSAPPRSPPPARPASGTAPKPAAPAPAAPRPASASKRPLDVLHTALNNRVIVLLKGAREYRGVLDGYDHPHLNLVLKNAEEYVNGEKKRDCSAVLVRGDNIVYISP